MEKDVVLSPPKAANHLNNIAKAVHAAHGGDRFPVNVDQFALSCADIFKWQDPIAKIEGANIPNFEGMLSSNEAKSKWMIVYNSNLRSQGRIRFTKAHELGHYILHRARQEEFMCSREDMLSWSSQKHIESEADVFASYLLMPLDDFRGQVKGQLNLDSLSHCADRYGVSLTASILKWLSYTSEKAVLIMSNDGYMNWASSSKAAFNAGAFFKTRNSAIEIPATSLAADTKVEAEKLGVRLPAKTWFPNADSGSELLEMKIYSDQYDSTLSLLILPKYTNFWPKRD